MGNPRRDVPLRGKMRQPNGRITRQYAGVTAKRSVTSHTVSVQVLCLNAWARKQFLMFRPFSRENQAFREVATMAKALTRPTNDAFWRQLHAHLRVRLHGLRQPLGRGSEDLGGPPRGLPQVFEEHREAPDLWGKLHPEGWRLVRRPVLVFAEAEGRRRQVRRRQRQQQRQRQRHHAVGAREERRREHGSEQRRFVRLERRWLEQRWFERRRLERRRLERRWLERWFVRVERRLLGELRVVDVEVRRAAAARRLAPL